MQENQPAIVTRFAPSPTGYLHIGGARTALFNWLYARGRGGKFLLRIEDTDRERSTDAAVTALLDGLSWLGLEWDGDAISQHARADRHREAAQQLLASGHAFRCYCDEAETAALRETAFAEGRALRSPWRDRDPSEAPEGAPFAIRFRAGDADVVVRDEVQGEVRWAGKDFDDLVLIRSDGHPTYNFAVVVDDHDMGVTHIIRGDDHLTNAGRQSQIYAAFGWPVPVFAHVTMIHGPDGKKLSKRHGALGAEAYRDMGYLPEGLRNYLLRLGWSHGDQEFFTDAEAMAVFDFDGLGKAPARLDFDKMASVNAQHMRLADDARLTKLAWPFIAGKVQAEGADEAVARDRLSRAMPLLKMRAQTLAELAEQSYFLWRKRPFAVDDKAARALDDEARGRLARLHARLAARTDWTEAELETALKDFAAKESVGFGKVGPALRAALTGGAPAPDLASVLALLGPEESLSRLEDHMREAG